MRVLVLSDSHGKTRNMARAIRQAGQIDLLIHLGDLEGGAGALRSMVMCPIEMVAGNCDYFSVLPREKVIMIGGQDVLITHGHLFAASHGTMRLRQAAAARGCRFCLFGHTHRPALLEYEGIPLLNPGSISFPRQEDMRPSYALLDVDEEGRIHASIEYLERE